MPEYKFLRLVDILTDLDPDLGGQNEVRLARGAAVPMKSGIARRYDAVALAALG